MLKINLLCTHSPYVKDLETVVELNRKTEKQFSSVRLGFFVNKRKDIRLVVARGSTVKISMKLHGNFFSRYRKALCFWSLGISLYLQLFYFLSCCCFF